MLIQENKFYKYKGVTKNFFINNEVYKLVDHIIEEHNECFLFENNEGNRCSYYGDITKEWIASGVQEVNWKNKNYSQHTMESQLYQRLLYLGIIPDKIRTYNVGASDYSKHIVQPWTIWLDYPELTSWDHDIIKRILRVKMEPGMSFAESRILDYEKIIHICQERLRQLKCDTTGN